LFVAGEQEFDIIICITLFDGGVVVDVAITII